MKNKFERLSKEDKKKAIEDYKNFNEKQKNVVNSYTRIKILCIAGLIFSLLSFGFDIYMKGDIFQYLCDGFLLIACLLAFYKFRDWYYKDINRYLINEKISKNTKNSKVKKNRK